MHYHFIAIYSHYSNGVRIGWHYTSDEKLDREIIQSFLDDSERKLGTADFGIHKLTTESRSWESVIEKDSFFENVIIIGEKDTFLETLDNDKNISVLDIAKFFLAYSPVTNLKLQKLIYFAYATYLNATEKSLFPERIVAYRYGPVVEEVYRLYKNYGKKQINNDDTRTFQLKNLPISVPMAKIALNDDSVNILNALRDTVATYIDKSASELVHISHVEGGPWDHANPYNPLNRRVTDEYILNYHIKELELIKKINKLTS